MSNSVNLALIGASGVVGKKILKVIENKKIPIDNFYPIGNSSVGSEVFLNNEKYIIIMWSIFNSIMCRC